MSFWFGNFKYVLLGLMFLSCAGATAYQWWYVWPERKCDQAGAWWDPEDHQCVTPLPIWRITGRAPGTAAPTSLAPARPADGRRP